MTNLAEGPIGEATDYTRRIVSGTTFAAISTKLATNTLPQHAADAITNYIKSARDECAKQSHFYSFVASVKQDRLFDSGYPGAGEIGRRGFSFSVHFLFPSFSFSFALPFFLFSLLFYFFFAG